MVKKSYLINKSGQSTVFDALLFFIILTSASIFIFIIPSTQISQNEDLLHSEYKNEFVDSTLSAVLKTTLNSTTFTRNGNSLEVIDTDMQTVIKLYLELKYEMRNGLNCDLTNMKRDINEKFRSVIPPEYEFSVSAMYVKGSDSIYENVAGSIAPKTTKYGSSFEVVSGDEKFLIILMIWD